MIYNNGEMLDSFLPKPLDGVRDLSYGAQSVSRADLITERHRLEAELRAIKDPTFREPFEPPSLPVGYVSHETDSTEVKALGDELNERLRFVRKSLTEHESTVLIFQAAVEKRSQDEADFRAALTLAIEAGKDIPEPVDHEDLTPLHKSLSKLEGAITVGVKVADESRAKLDEAYEDLYASAEYRGWADKELAKRTQDAVRALELLRTALGARESVLSNLPDAYADLDGVPFVEPMARRNRLGFGGMDPYSSNEKSISVEEALSKVESVTIPGDGIRKWSKSQLSNEELEDYADRAAFEKIERDSDSFGSGRE
ncbi:hypothetical protein ACIA8J_11745 [Streptomyces asoensis]|uniref:hypothetical protein n=1 Tax=Streptomyces asoensis TaxID=249586 RepID=UPI00378F33DA